jgi:pimeloyl-ACP methyl ester carboxylesterase
VLGGKSSGMVTPILATTSTARTRDGRCITYTAAGPRDGFPVVYCHGAIGSPRWRTPTLDAHIERLRIRYLVVNRPGFAGSDPSPGRTVADFARDLEDVLGALGHERFSVVGVSAGAPYALACGHALGDRISALTIVSPLGPPGGAGASPSARYAVPLIPFGNHRFGPTLAGLYLRALGLRRETTPQAMIDDYLVCRRDWGFQTSALRCPVTLWHGDSDPLIPLAHIRRLAAAIPSCQAHVDPGGGHFFYGGRLTEILGPLVAEAQTATRALTELPHAA